MGVAEARKVCVGVDGEQQRPLASLYFQPTPVFYRFRRVGVIAAGKPRTGEERYEGEGTTAVEPCGLTDAPESPRAIA